MTLNSRVLPSNGVVSLTGRVSISEPGQEGADAVGHDGEAALDLAGDGAGDQVAGLERLLELHPGGQPLGAIARQARLAEAVFQRIDRDRNEVADRDFEFTAIVVELFDRNVALGFQPRIDDDVVVIDADDFRGDHLALAHFLPGERFLEQRCETLFLYRAFRNCCAH